MRKVIPETSLSDFLEAWKPDGLIVASKTNSQRHTSAATISHRQKFPTLEVPLCYRPVDTRLQNIDVVIQGKSEKQILVLNDIVTVNINVVEDALAMNKSQWTIGDATTIHSAQGLTISDTTLWIVDDRIEWSNLVYLAVSRVRKMTQLQRIVLDTSTRSVVNELTHTDQIRKKIDSYRQSDKQNNRRFDLNVDLVLSLRKRQDNHCASCNCIMLWQYSKNNPRQVTVDRKDSNLGHIRENVMLTCIECNRRRGAAAAI